MKRERRPSAIPGSKPISAVSGALDDIGGFDHELEHGRDGHFVFDQEVGRLLDGRARSKEIDDASPQTRVKNQSQVMALEDLQRCLTGHR
jgi:hypothetical protein